MCMMCVLTLYFITEISFHKISYKRVFNKSKQKSNRSTLIQLQTQLKC